jgi:hypothetical protein
MSSSKNDAEKTCCRESLMIGQSLCCPIRFLLYSFGAILWRRRFAFIFYLIIFSAHQNWDASAIVSVSLQRDKNTLKVHTLAWDFRLLFSFIKSTVSYCNSHPRSFSHINLNLPRYSNLKIILCIIRIRGKNFLGKLGQKNWLLIFGLRSSCTEVCICPFLSYLPTGWRRYIPVPSSHTCL